MSVWARFGETDLLIRQTFNSTHFGIVEEGGLGFRPDCIEYPGGYSSYSPPGNQ